MQRLILITAAIVAVSAALASQTAANTTQSVSMTFAEPVHPSARECPGFPDAACGSGEVIPLGQSTETLQFGGGCGGSCDLRTINLADGSLILEETVTDPTCPHVCRPGPLELGRGTANDVVIGGTGMYEGATGELTGTIIAAISNERPAGTSIVQLSGTIHYDP